LGPLASTVLAKVPPQHAGAASGVLSTALQIGNALGVAVIGFVFYDRAGPSGDRESYVSAFESSLLYLMVIGLAVALLAQLLPADKVSRR
jgi:predicted MFS family arabinose efflux permease